MTFPRDAKDLRASAQAIVSGSRVLVVHCVHSGDRDAHASMPRPLEAAMNGCTCSEPHELRRIVLTGGPGAGKTAVLELMRKTLCKHVKILPESAGIVFGGGFPRGDAAALRRAGQRAIFYVQRELEEAAHAENVAISLCDRGTVDGLAYWPGPDELWPEVGTSLAAQLARYDAVIHLRTPSSADYNHQNPLRIETAREAAAIDARIAAAWSRHPRRFEVSPARDFLAKAARAIELVRGELPACCKRHPVAELGERD
jgi:predicted ATPase